MDLVVVEGRMVSATISTWFIKSKNPMFLIYKAI